jgi:malate dehydrogenase (oxaloacetate-decarboxylating)(NADP+)
MPSRPMRARWAEVIVGADVFLGLSAGGVLKKEMVAKMAPSPLIMALANPNPEIGRKTSRRCVTMRSSPPAVRTTRTRSITCSAFPFIFRGALDVGATTITEAMKLAAVRAIAELARVEQSEVAVKAYGEKHANFGPEYLIPNPFDPRLIGKIAPAVAEAAMASGSRPGRSRTSKPIGTVLTSSSITSA